MHLPADRHETNRRSIDVLEVRVDGFFADDDLVAIELHVVTLTVQIDDVFHAAEGTSSHTDSTCAVCGNMSNGTSDTTRYPGMRAMSRASVAGLQLTYATTFGFRVAVSRISVTRASTCLLYTSDAAD